MPKPAVTMPSWTAAPMGRPNTPAACCWLPIAQAGSSCAITYSALRRAPTGLSLLGTMYTRGPKAWVVGMARIDLFSPFRIALEANQRKVGLHHARLDIGDPHARPLQVGAERQRELFDERLGRAIDVPAGIGVAACRRADIDDMAAATFDHARQQRSRCEHQSLVVGVDHGFPIVRVGLLRRIGAQCQSRIVDQ